MGPGLGTEDGGVKQREGKSPHGPYIYNLRENLDRLTRMPDFYEFWIKSYQFRAYLLRMD